MLEILINKDKEGEQTKHKKEKDAAENGATEDKKDKHNASDGAIVDKDATMTGGKQNTIMRTATIEDKKKR